MMEFMINDPKSFKEELDEKDEDPTGKSNKIGSVYDVIEQEAE